MRKLVGLSVLMAFSIFVQAALPGTGQAKQSLVGKWKVVKSQGEEGKDPGTMEFLKDGRVIIMEKRSKPKNGSYSTDETTIPATIMVKILTDDPESHQKVIVDCPGIYKFERKRLILKIVNAPKTAAPKDFTVDTDGYTNLELVR
jgi:uncharacterized protein (TIGR03067 family)